MIRHKDKIYGEANHEETVISVGTLTANRYVIFDNEKRLKIFSPGNKRIMITNSLGEVDSFGYTNGFTAYVGTNGLGQLKFYEKTTLPVSPPANRTLVREVIGSSIPDGLASEVNVNLLPNYWYEIEVVGAGGGGGGGAFWNSYVESSTGGTGGGGGYFKGIFSITKPTTAIIYAGNSGGGGDGFRKHLNVSGEEVQYGSNKGGIGGRHIPIVPDSKGYDGDGYLGGQGIHAGARGGNTYPPATQSYDGGGGGGSDGQLGGRGGDFVENNVDALHYRGSGGGAGGGLYGIGGDGAGDIFPSGTRAGSKGLGGGGGGNGYISSALGVGHPSSGGGGGGGGATRAKMGTISIQCGGGGGGAGGGDAGPYPDQYVVEDGENGQVNIFTSPFHSSTTGVATNGGAGGLGKNNSITPTQGQLFSCVGGNGGYGKVTIWRLE